MTSIEERPPWQASVRWLPSIHGTVIHASLTGRHALCCGSELTEGGDVSRIVAMPKCKRCVGMMEPHRVTITRVR